MQFKWHKAMALPLQRSFFWCFIQEKGPQEKKYINLGRSDKKKIVLFL